MRTLIISDVHSNLTALKAVLEDAEPFDRVWCLGDIVGYGPDPNECIETIRNLPMLECVKGNHDAAILGEIDIKAFNYEARVSLEWLDSVLEPENRRWLAQRPERIISDGITLVHGSPRRPVWEYVMAKEIARENMKAFNTQICLVGHTHIPCVFSRSENSAHVITLEIYPLDEPIKLDQKCIVNPGSVGQPRDHDPRASYLIFDDEQASWVFRRVQYDLESVQKRILAAGLPYRHASRLSEGW